MLSFKEKKVMSFLYKKCKDKKSCLISPTEIADAMLPKYDLEDVEIEDLVNGLELDNYINVINSDSNGKLIYCISLKQKGKAFERDKKVQKKQWAWWVSRTIILAIISFIVGIILKAIF